MNQDVAIYKNILDNMHGGVLTVGLDGRILTFNPGAARILGIARDEVVGHIFAEVFLAREGMGAFAQAIMDAIYEAEVEHQRMVEVRYGGNTVSLAMTTSYLLCNPSGTVRSRESASLRYSAILRRSRPCARPNCGWRRRPRRNMPNSRRRTAESKQTTRPSPRPQSGSA